MKVLRGGAAVLFGSVTGTQNKICQWTKMGGKLPSPYQTFGQFLILRNIQKSGEFYTSTISNDDGISQNFARVDTDGKSISSEF